MTGNVAQLIEQITSRGIELGIVDQKLAFRPSEKATPEIRELIGVHKVELLDYLKRQSEPDSTKETFSNPLDLNDMLAFPVHLLGELPLPPVLVVEIAGFDVTVVLDFRKRPDTWRSTWRRKPKARPIFELGEIEALTAAAEHGCVKPHVFLTWCQRKQSEPHWYLTRETAFDNCNRLLRTRAPEPRRWSLGCVLRAIGGKLRLIRISSPQRSQSGSYAKVELEGGQ